MPSKINEYALRKNIICTSCKSSLENIGTYCPYCGYDSGGDAQCLTCGNIISQIEYWSNHHRCPHCKANPYHRIINKRYREFIENFAFIKQIKLFHKFILKSIDNPNPSPVHNWKIGMLMLTLLLLISLPLILIGAVLAFYINNGLVRLAIIVIFGTIMTKKFPKYTELFRIKEVGLALIKRNITNYKTHSEIPRESAVILRNFKIDSSNSFEPWLKHIYRFLGDVGSVFAFGKPGEIFKSGKVAKIYIQAEDNWYDILREVINRVKIICIIHDCSDGLVWEIKQCIIANDPRKVVIFIPPYEFNDSYVKINDALNEKIDHLLPKSIPVIEDMEVNKFGFIAFDDEWLPYLIKPTGVYYFFYKFFQKVLFTNVYTLLFASYFKPIFKKVGSSFTRGIRLRLFSIIIWRFLVLLLYAFVIFGMIRGLVLNTLKLTI